MGTRPLSPFERWMVDRNLEYVAVEGLETVLARLRSQGYNRVADAVEQGRSNENFIVVGRTVSWWLVQG